MAKKLHTRVIQEFNTKGQHRIVVLKAERVGTVQEHGQWAESHEIATYDRYRANSGYFKNIPFGVFTTNKIQHDVLH